MIDPTRRQIMEMADEVGITDHAAAVKLVRRAFEVFRPVPVPVPVSERLPGAGDRDALGCNWWHDRLNGAWVCCDETYARRHCYTHWLPAHALPIPGQGGH